MATLAGGEEDEWWTRISTDTSKCGIEDAGKARPLSSASRQSGGACAAECRCCAAVAQSDNADPAEPGDDDCTHYKMPRHSSDASRIYALESCFQAVC